MIQPCPVHVCRVRCVLLSAPYSAAGDAERELHLRSGYRSAAFFVAEGEGSAYGVGEAYAGSYAPEVVQAIAEQILPELKEIDVVDVDALMAKLRHQVRYWGRAGVTQGVLGGIEMALLDLIAKDARKPLCDMFPGRKHASLPVYASGGNDKPYSDLEAEMQGYVQAGYSAVKIRVNNLPLDKAVEKVGVAARVLEGKASLAVDAVQSNTRYPWTLEEAIRAVKAFAPFELLWLEEPLPPEDVVGLAKLREMAAVSIASGETATTLDEVERYLHHGSIDILQPDAAVMGVGQFLRASRLCAEAGITVAVHAWCGAPGHLGNYHAALAAPNCTIVEMSAVPNPLREELMDGACSIEGGHVRLSGRPGLGITLPEDFEARFPYRRRSHYSFGAR